MVDQTYNENGNGIKVIQGAIIPHCELCEEWAVVPRVMPINQFVGWGSPGIKENCFDYAWAQLKKAGYTLKSPSWSTNNKISSGIYQIFFTEPVGGITKKEQGEQSYIAGVKYLKKTLNEGIPVMVGIDLKVGTSNADKVTDHFVVIVGMGIDDIGNYFLFDDNATGAINVGASDLNRLYCLCNQWLISGVADERNTYAHAKNHYDKYTVTQIRESKKI